MRDQLLDKIANKNAVIGIYGLGYVGLPLAIRFSESGFRVIGFDIDVQKVHKLASGESYIKHIDSSVILEMRSRGFVATGDFSQTAKVDAIIICVPTPLGKHKDPDMSYIMSTLSAIKPYLRVGQVLSLESTTYPGTTEELIVAGTLKNSELVVGENFFVVFSPEREDPGRTDFTTKTIPKVCGGHTESCLVVGSCLYESVIDRVVRVSSTKVAEMSKLLENIHRAVNIGLINEMKVICDKMGIDIYEVIRASSTKPFGFVPYYPGPGLGGHCIPIDPFYLTWKAREYGVDSKFIELAGEINSNMPRYVIDKISLGLNSRQKSIKSSSILVLGVSYKKNVDDLRESPSLEIMEHLTELGAHVGYSDPYFEKLHKMRNHDFNLTSIDLNEKVVSAFDCVVLATDHDQFDYTMIKSSAKLIIDCRGRYSELSDKVIKA